MRTIGSEEGIELWAPAKLNLFFEILGRRGDGYHEVQSLMLPINLYDTLSVRRTSSLPLRLECRVADPYRPAVGGELAEGRATIGLPDVESNLVYRAMALVARHRPDGGTWQARLVKRIPSAAGLGGASSDAAALLMAAGRLLDPAEPAERLREWGAALGSDVPFFLDRQAGWCHGRGEMVEPLSGLPLLHFVVVKPPVGLSTPEVYGQVRVPAEPRDVEPLLWSLRRGRLSDAGRRLFNRLTEAAETLTPWVARIRGVFQRMDVLGHQMSGSGTSYFGLCYNAGHATRVASRLRSQRLGSVYAVRSLHQTVA
ncbi:MAG: hypothetical protein U0795_15725 [Pirellulales bacterium]